MAKLKNQSSTITASKANQSKGAKKVKNVGKKNSAPFPPEEPLLDPRYVNLVRLCFVKIRRPKKTTPPPPTQNDLPKTTTPSSLIDALRDQCTTRTTKSVKKATKKHSNSIQKATILSQNQTSDIIDKTLNKGYKEPLLDPRYKNSVRLCFVKLRRFNKSMGAPPQNDVLAPEAVKLKSVSCTMAQNDNSVRRCFVKVHRFAEPSTSTTYNGASVQSSIQFQTPNTAALPQNQTAFTAADRLRRAGNALRENENVARISQDKENNEHSSQALRSCRALTASSPLTPAAKVAISKSKRVALVENNRNIAKSITRHLPFASALTSARREDIRKPSLNEYPNNTAAPTPSKENEIAHFEPLGNSTLHECGIAKALQKSPEDIVNLKKTVFEKLSSPTENIEESAPDKSRDKSSENFINKTDEIEQILLSMEEDDVEAAPNNEALIVIASSAATSNTKHKFFHRNADISSKIASSKPKVITRKKILSSTKNGKQRTTLKRKSSVGKVYDFLSQSQSSGSDTVKNTDPAADIIRRLIDEGKVQVATMRKGTGKPTIKRKKRTALPKKLKKPVIRKPIEMPNIVEISSSGEHEPDDFDYDDNMPLPDNDEEESTEPLPVSAVHQNSNARQKHDNSNEGTFSRLARSVLIHQAEKIDTQRTKIANKQRLLEVARKFVSTPVSTPVNRKLPPPTHTSNLSPIAAPGQAGNASPWRVNDDANLPSVSYFSRNSVNGPSFSSDFIPATPTKDKSIRQLHYSVLEPLDTTAGENDGAPLFPVPPLIPSMVLEPPDNAVSAQIATVSSDIPLVPPPLHDHTLSSFSSNDSNAENVRPPTQLDENAKATDISLLRHLPNPRRTLNERSALQAIDILEVLTLPSWKNTENNAREMAEKSPSPRGQATNNISNLFGFEDDDDLSNYDDTFVDSSEEHSKETSLRNRLQELRKIRPADEELIKSISKPIRGVFDEIGGKPKQRGIKEMLCSTMMNEPQPSTSRNCVARSEGIEGYFNQQNVQEQQEASPEDDMSELFTSMPRTYVRPRTKRKRKLRHNFVMFLDSDESGEEESEPEKKKRQKTERKPNPELNTFVNEFNEMCRDVERYEIVVERSA